ncbi:hypothetical protein HHI36_019248 [Cryptolaemus montrouzieri]|uniref:Uncharacterized protein n=1 Tax=Cryptolaemus montrouzieri TaxID=559131 RepID=A0ABD2P2D5_9CUCU
MVLKTYTRKRKSNDMGTPEPPKKPLITPIPMSNQPDPKIDIVPSKPPDVYITKSSRVIKKKVIWDPDEAMPSVRNQSKILSKIEATSKTTPSPKNAAAPKSTATLKISTPKVVDRKSTEKDKHIDTPKSVKPIEKRIIKSGPEDEGKNIVAIDKNAIKKPDRIEVVRKIKSPVVIKNSIVSRAKVITVKSTGAGISPVISPGKSPKKSFKRLSEIDKLLMDEGAVNMLYDINNSDEQKRRSNRTTVISTDKAQNQKELINRTQEVKNELTQGTVVETVMPKILRKKEGPPTPKKEIVGPSPIRKMSKDSSKSSVHSPPPSPAAFAMADASRIIRRHSSSSFSSNDDLVQETLADHDNKDKEKHVKKKPAAPKASSSTVEEEVAPKETVKERAVKKKTVAPQESTPRKKLKKDDSSTKNEEQEKPVEITIKSEPGNVTGELKTDPTKAFTVIKMNKHYMINLTYSGSENYLTVQLLKDLTVTLKELGRNKNCHVVSLHSQGVAFCLGLDYKGLVESNEDLRKRRATELSNCIREFLKCLLNFPKVIVAGIKGDCVGFGVTMLPLFDMIVASDSASFCTPYGKLGCAPEAGFLLSIPFQSNHGLASELLYTSHRMNADEAQRRGLVTKLFWPEKFDTEFRALMAHISNLSKVGLIATKKQLRLLHCQTTEVALANTCKTLIDFWIGEECQKNFTNYNALTFDIDQ